MLSESVKLPVRAHPGARVEKVVFTPRGALEAWVRAPALDGRANAAIVAAVAGALGLRPRQVRLVRGGRSRDKLVEIDLPSVEAVADRLGCMEHRP